MKGGGWAVQTRVELVFAFDAISAMSAEGRHANAAPCEVHRWMAARLVETIKLQVLGAEEEEMG